MAELGSRVGMVGVAYHVKPHHEKDPKQVLLDNLGEIPSELVMFNRILLAKYVRPEINKIGSILITDNRKDQEKAGDHWQGKACLVVAMGPQAYEDDESTKFYGQKVNVGDWVWCRASDGLACEVNDVLCLVVHERDIIGKLPDPDYIW